MINWLQVPKSQDVAKYIECYWLIEKLPGAESYQYPKLNPDPAAHLIISPSHQAYHYGMDVGTADGYGSHLLLPHLQTFQLDHSKPFIHLGVKFNIGALYSLGLSAYSHPSLDAIEGVNLASLFSSSEFNQQRLMDIAINDPEACCDQLDALFLPWLDKVKEDQHSALTRKALTVLDSTSISAMGEQLFCSQRTLERSFSRVTGLTLKQCQTMNKLEAMLEYLYQRNADEIDWVDVALKFGFSDQPHLIRHLKKQIGQTPKKYAKDRGLTIDVYGGVN
ncbi:helix-turn-helix domain-containing protein [Shewanella eurypsychrophilus]|uniref:Helix-turn-helix domain-containing protein n=1 Tax=Shewanella eurypsychrophilus TaxID=2593656 RepID=A0ABX6V3X0_9GAMM|nr:MULTISPECIES: helix-turn-helix domain-containing protein [Shewanella]QFU21976.1 helix-turn-helix domain-containing protein [Shewanella sp. YLB-09]QPG57265.1 helix-turn-helix domain-containing protein [Shewanella eurypsychrophilus]